MKLSSILTVSSLLLIQSCSAGLWGSSSKTDPIVAEGNLPSAPISKFDYKLSFKKNFYYNGSVPFWTTGGDLLKSTDFIRLSPSIPNAKGWIWSDIPNPYEEWEVEIAFKVTGNNMNGGRGLAFWYAKESKQTGPVFGSKDKWDGLGVWLDSANPRTHKPSTMVLLNDGTLGFAEGVDPTKHMLGSCSISFRNTENPVLLKVTYKENTLSVFMDNGSGNKDYLICVKKSGIKLPTGYYFGVSAASHTPADDHDIISFETRQLNPPQKLEHPKRPMEEEKKKRGEEFSGIDEEQKKKIEEAEFQMRKLRESSEENQGDTSVTLAAIYDTQRRAFEQLEIMQMQIEALGAPSPSDAITGNYNKIDWSKLGSGSITKGSNGGADSADLKRIAEQAQSDSQKSLEQFENLAKEQNRKMSDIQKSIKRLEETLSSLDSRILSQNNLMQKKMNEVKLHSAETKGTMSTFLKYIFYAFVAQFLFGIAVYLYWKLRVERNDKKFV